MSEAPDYGADFQFVDFEREDGILTVRLHTDGGPLLWSPGIHRELGEVFGAVARDPDNSVVILTGTGDAFCAELDYTNFKGKTSTPLDWDLVQREARAMLENHLAIPVPMIGIVNGPARIHAELALMCDVVLAADHVAFQDSPHFPHAVVPGDGVHVIWPMLLGLNRARYFLVTGQTIDAGEALALGVVNEVMPGEELAERAMTLAREIARRPPLALRYTRECITLGLKEEMTRQLRYGLALEGLNTVQLAGWRLGED